jgi:TPR repeat protein
LKWYRKAAEQDNAVAQSGLGFMYLNGKGVLQDYGEAAKWLRLGADQGIADAQLTLGIMYQNADGVPQDYVQAHMWFNLAASRPYPKKETREEAAKARDSIASKMTPAQIAEAQKLVRDWKPAKQPTR